MPESKVVAISHEKGSVGKTTTTVNLGVGLVRQGKKVLLVDADPQGDLTKCLGIANPQELTLTLATAMNSIISETEFDPCSMILHHQEGVDFIPANSNLNAVETTLVTTMDIDRRCVLRDYLGLVRDSYEYQKEADCGCCGACGGHFVFGFRPAEKQGHPRYGGNHHRRRYYHYGRIDDGRNHNRLARK